MRIKAIYKFHEVTIIGFIANAKGEAQAIFYYDDGSTSRIYQDSITYFKMTRGAFE
jgi:hypothetical protein